MSMREKRGKDEELLSLQPGLFCGDEKIATSQRLTPPLQAWGKGWREHILGQQEGVKRNNLGRRGHGGSESGERSVERIR